MYKLRKLWYQNAKPYMLEGKTKKKKKKKKKKRTHLWSCRLKIKVTQFTVLYLYIMALDSELFSIYSLLL